PRYRCDRDLLDEVPGESGVVIESERPDARHHVVRTIRRRRLEAAFLKAGHDRISPLLVIAEQLNIEGRGKVQRGRDGDLERMRGADCEEVMNLANARGQRGGRVERA